MSSTRWAVHLRRWPVVGLALVVLAVAGCGSDSDSGSGSSSGSSNAASSSGNDSVKGKKIVAVMSAGSLNAWSAAANATMVKIWKDAGIDVTLLEDPINVAEQARHIDQAIALKPDLLVINVYDTNSIIPKLRKAKQAGIPVMSWNGALNATAQAMVATSINANNSDLGKFAGQAMVAGLQKAGYDKANIIAITGTAASDIVQDRVTAFKQELAKHPGYNLVQSEDANWDPVLSGQKAAQVLSAWKSKGGIQGAFGMADYMALPIATAAKQLGMTVGSKPGDMVLVASNCTAAGAKAVKDGVIYGMADQTPGPEATVAANTAMDILKGKKVKNDIITSVNPITQDNVDEYLTKCDY
jgi:ABC-type sugar transport system substrate-binding protein